MTSPPQAAGDSFTSPGSQQLSSKSLLILLVQGMLSRVRSLPWGLLKGSCCLLCLVGSLLGLFFAAWEVNTSEPWGCPGCV